ncbi:MAG: hypothetical protein ACXIUL_03875 [Wenzhouxiangella sp.]
MSRLNPSSHRRLEWLGISRWQRRSASEPAATRPELSAPPSRPEPVAETGADLTAEQALSIRLASGSGDWLLVQQAPWRGDHAALMDDIRACLGTHRCRFGQWAQDSAAGEGQADLAQRGVRQILSFGPPPRSANWPMLIIAPSLDELAGSGDARRALWQLIAPHWPG